MRNTARARNHLVGWGAIVFAALFGVAVLGTPALAKPKGGGGKRVAVLPPTDGTPKDAVITAKIAKALKKQGIKPITGGPVKKAVAMGVPAGDAEWMELARKLRVDGIVEPIVSGSGGKRRVEVVVHNGLDGSVAGRESFSAKGPPAKLAAAAAGGVWRKLGSTIRATEPPKRDAAPTLAQAPAAPEPASSAQAEEPAANQPSEPLPGAADETSKPKPLAAKPAVAKVEAEDEEDEDDDEDEEPASKQPGKAKRGESTTGKPRALEVEIGGRALQRLFQYRPTSAAKSYSENFLPVFQGRVVWFPVTYVGISLSAEYNPALKSGDPAYPTGARELMAGVQARYPLSVGVLGLSVSYFQHTFVIGDTSDTSDQWRRDLVWPNTAYQGARIGVGGRFYLWSVLQVGAGVAYRLVTSPGEGELRVRSSHYFPDGKVSYGMDGSLFLGVGITSWLEIRAGVDYRRYAFGALVPGPDNTNGTNATGAVDQYLGYTLGLVGVYGGK